MEYLWRYESDTITPADALPPKQFENASPRWKKPALSWRVGGWSQSVMAVEFTNYWFTKLDLNQGAQVKLNQNKSTLSN